MGRKAGRSLLVALAIALAALAAWRVTSSVDSDATPAPAGDVADAPDAAQARERELAALAQGEAGRLQRLPGLRLARHGEGSVVGKVALYVAGRGATPLAGVTIDLAASVDGRELRATGETAADGSFSLAPVPAAVGYALRARHEGHRDLVVGGVVVGEGRVVDVGTLVFGAPTTLSGSVVDGTGRPIGDALVSVEVDRVRGGAFNLFTALRDLAEGPGPLAQARTEADGTFAVKGLPPGRYTVRVVRGGYAASFHPGVFVTVDGDTTGVRVVLEAGAGFEGRVTDVSGAPVAGAVVVALPVKIERLEAYERHEARTDANGRYRLDTLTDDAVYFVEAVAADHAPFGRLATTHRVQPLDFGLVAAGRVEGRVLDAKTNAPLPGAEVLLLTGLAGAGTAPASVVADGLGRFAFEHALPGPVLLLDARVPGYGRGTIGFDAKAPRVVRAGETLAVDLLLPVGGTIHGTVRGDDGRPLPFVSVVAYLPNSQADGEVAVLTDAQGAFRLVGLRPETWFVSVTAPGWASPVEDADVRVAMPEAGDVARDFVLTAGGTLEGHVTTSERAPAAGVRVAVLARDARRFGARVRDLVVVTDGGGAYRIAGVPAAVDVVVEVVGPTGVTTRSDGLRVTAGERKTVDVVLRPGAKLVGRVVDAAGRPVERARVRFGHVEPEDLARLDNSFRADDHLGPRTYLADASGGFRCDDAPPGPVLLRVDAEGFAPWFRRDLVVPPEGDLAGISVVLDGAKSVSGRILAADTGKPFAGAWIFAVARGARGDNPDGGRVDPLVTMETGADGAYLLPGLPPGPVDVVVSLCLGYKNGWQDPSGKREAVAAGSTGVDFRLVPVVDPNAPR